MFVFDNAGMMIFGGSLTRKLFLQEKWSTNHMQYWVETNTTIGVTPGGWRVYTPPHLLARGGGPYNHPPPQNFPCFEKE